MFLLQSEGSYLHPPGSIGFAHIGALGWGADGAGGCDDGTGTKGKGKRWESGQERRGNLGRIRGNQSGMQDGAGSSSGGGDPDGARIRVGGDPATVPAWEVSLCNQWGWRRWGRGRGWSGCGGHGVLRAAAGAVGQRCQRSPCFLLEEEGVCQVGGGRSKSRAPGQVTETGVRLPLSGVVVEMGDQAHPQRVSAVQTFNYAQVASRLSQTLPEPQSTVIHRQGMSIKVPWG